MLNSLVSKIDLNSLRVHFPTKVVFLCGGAIDSSDPPAAPSMLRDVYYRHRKSTLEKLAFQIVLAEDADPLTTDAGYEDLLSFESDVAQIVCLIVLFVESAGSFAELGAFSALGTIAPNLLAVLIDHYYEQKSFIMNGPIKYLENHHGEDSVLSLDMATLKITNPKDVSTTSATELAKSLEETIAFRLDKLSKWKAFDPKSNGHKILVMTGLCQEYGALTQSEVRSIMKTLSIDVDSSDLKRFLYCAELMKWVKVSRKGHQKYIVALSGNNQEKALDWKFLEDAPYKDRLRWRTDIRLNWSKTDKLRFRAIVEAEVENG